MNINDIEFASQLAWPALEEVACEGGLLRFASGVSRRSNSMIPSLTDGFCPNTLIRKAENYYARKGQATVVKVLAEKASRKEFALLDALLEGNSYEKESPTAVMGLNLNGGFIASNPNPALQLVQCNKLEWVKAWHSLRQLDPEQLAVYCQLSKRIDGKACRLLLKDQNQVLATGMAVLQKDAESEAQLQADKLKASTDSGSNNKSVKLGIFGMATAAAFQGQGFGSSILFQLLSWGKQQGAEYAYLQVENNNRSARALYTKFGFKDVYSYWYRVKDCPERCHEDN